MARKIETYTGIMMLKRPYHCSHISAYCTGGTTKNAYTRTRWSASLVGSSVTNSRSARSEITLKSTIETIGPAVMASANTSAITHHARMRALTSSEVARPDTLVTRRPRIHAATEDVASSASTL